VFRLNASKSVQVDIVDAATATAVDESSLTTLAGTPESKIFGALVKVVRTVLVPGTDYVVVGQLIAAGKNGPGVAVQLKYNRRIVAGDMLYGLTPPPAPPGGSAPPVAKADTAGSEKDAAGKPGAKDAPADGPKAPGHNDLLGIVATWLNVELQREMSGGHQAHLEATFGSADTRSLIFQHIGSQAMTAGDLAGARRAYAHALDQDFSNVAARLGLAQVLARSLGPDAKPDERKSATKALSVTSKEVYEQATPTQTPLPPPSDVELSARYTELAAQANLDALNNNLPAAGPELAALKNRIDKIRVGDPRRGPMLAAYYSLELATLSDQSINNGINGQGIAHASISEASNSLRGRYNLAARYCQLPDALRANHVETITTYLREAVSLPLMATFATTDPYFDDVMDKPWFNAIVPKRPDVAPNAAGNELSALHSIGTHFATKLAALNVDSLDDLRALGRARVATIARGLGVDRAVVRAWRQAARLAAVAAIGSDGLNLLLLSGVSSPVQLAGESADSVHAMLHATGMAHGIAVPALSVVRDWIAAARDQTVAQRVAAWLSYMLG
jgi:hypothetical protein